MKKRGNLKLLVLCLIVVYATGFLGSLFTSMSVNSYWYDSVRPSITPPNWIFPVAWNILFLLIALALYFSLIYSNKDKQKKKIWLVFGLNLILNLMWSIFYFGLRSPLFAFIDIILLLISILFLINISYKTKKQIPYLLIPYFLWVLFAGVLNYLSLYLLYSNI